MFKIGDRVMLNEKLFPGADAIGIIVKITRTGIHTRYGVEFNNDSVGYLVKSQLQLILDPNDIIKSMLE